MMGKQGGVGMIKGMTGFGSAQLASGTIRIMVELKSVNHRYFDVSYYLPVGFGSIEEKIRQILQKDIKRGKVTVSIKVMQKPNQTISLNKELVKEYLKYSNKLKKDFNLQGDLDLSDLFKLPGVLEAKETYINPEDVWVGLEKNIVKALKGLVIMRKREGKALLADVADKLKEMTSHVKDIQSRTKELLKGKKAILKSEEFSSYQKSSDINEELSRLSHYIDEMKLLLKSTIPIGKQIDFIAQEMQRETNTIGSKLQDSVVSNAVISLKSKIEKIREQAQNIE